MTTGRADADTVVWSTTAFAEPVERAAAWLIDTAIFWVVWIAGMILLIETGELGDPPRWAAPRALAWLAVVWLLSRCYDALSVSRWGSTAGRRVLDIEVRDHGGALPGVGGAVVRSVARTLGSLVFGVGLIPMWTDPQRRAWHDRLAGTVVVRAEALESADGGPGGVVGDDAPVDPTEAAIRAALVDPQRAGWLRAVAAQTEARLDVAAPSWRRGDDPGQTAQRAFCLMLAALIDRYPEQRPVLVSVLDAHRVLHDVAGNRERALTALVADDERARRWLGLPETAGVHLLVDAPRKPDRAGQPGTRARR